MFRIEPADGNVLERFGPDVSGVLMLGPDGFGSEKPPGPRELRVPRIAPAPYHSFQSLTGWQSRLLPFLGRAPEMSELMEWIEEEPAISLRFMAGAPSCGKSRLAAELCEAVRANGWGAGFVNPSCTQAIVLRRAGTLLVIDGAVDFRTEVEELLQDMAVLAPDWRLRVLVVVGEKTALWEAAVRRSFMEARVTRPPLVLEPLGEDDVRAALRESAEAAGRLFGLAAVPLADERAEEFVKAGHGPTSAALSALALLADSAPEAFARFVSPVEAAEGAAPPKNWIDDMALERAYFVATISGSVSLKTLRLLARSGLLGEKMTEEQLSESTWVEPTQWDGDVALHAPQPSIAAAAFAIGVVARNPKIAPELIWVALRESPPHAIARFGGLLQACENELGISLDRLRNQLVAMVEGDIKRCCSLDRWLTLFRVSDLLTPVAVLTTRVAISVEKDPARLLTKWSRLADSLETIEDEAGAIAAAHSYIEILRNVARTDPVWRDPDFGEQLVALADTLETEDRPAAYQLLRDSLVVFEPLAKTDVVGWGERYVTIFDLLADWLEKDGDLDGAIAALESTLPIRRGLAKEDEDGSLACSLLRMTLERLWELLHDEELRFASWIRDPRDEQEDRAFGYLQELIAVLRRFPLNEHGRPEPSLVHHLVAVAEELRVRDRRGEAIACLREGVKLAAVEWADNEKMQSVLEWWRTELAKWEKGEDLEFEEQFKKEMEEEQRWLAERDRQRALRAGGGSDGEQGIDEESEEDESVGERSEGERGAGEPNAGEPSAGAPGAGEPGAREPSVGKPSAGEA